MKISTEVEKFEPEPTFENTINEIKSNNLKIIDCATMNISSTTLFDYDLETLSMNNSFEEAKFEPKTTLQNTINYIKYDH